MKKTNQKALEEIIRVDHAGERGAIKIYEGQLLALKTIKQDNDLKDKIEEMKEQEKKHLEYLEKEVKLGTKVNHIMRHADGLYHGQIGSKNWKRYLSDNMMARDSDFQKAKHIMTIVQNNEKINRTTA